MDNIFIAPAAESLFYGPVSIWPPELMCTEKLRLMTSKRLQLCENLDYLLSLLAWPGLSLSRVISNPNCDLERIINLYDGLSDFIKESEVNRRLVLYLPFEIIPERGISGLDLFKKAVLNFQSTYLDAWFQLLFKSEFRANFSDGDIWEPELGYGKSEMICKATHLIPMLLQKRLISFEQVIRLLNEASSSKIKSGVSEALMAANELGIVTYSPELRKIQEPDFIVVGDQKNLALLMTEAVNKCLEDKENVIKHWSQIFPSRIIWEEEVNRQQIIKKYATIISNSIISTSLGIDIFAKHIKSSLNPYFILLSIYSLQRIVEKLHSYKQPRAVLIANDFKTWLLRTWQIDSVEIKKTIESAVQRWFNADIVDISYLSSFGFTPIDFNSQFSGEKVCSPLEVEELTRSISLIQESSELSAYFYPVVLIYGSRVKGYGSKYADIDLAVFVRPEVDYDSQQELITSLLKTVFKQEKIEGKVLQFWLTSDNNHLSVRDNLEGNHRFIAKNFYAHVLFDGAWFGAFEAIKELHAKLLVPYFFHKEAEFVKICLRELERYNLQYRLLHKGYANFFPERGGLATKFIDGQSTFYDSGYRHLASKIFIQKIFLPKLS